MSLDFTGAKRGTVLEHLAADIAKKPGALRLIVDREAPGLDEPLTIHLKDATAEQALKAVMGENLDYVIQDDGSVLVSVSEKVSHYTRKRCYEVSQVIIAWRLIQGRADTGGAVAPAGGGGPGGLFTMPAAPSSGSGTAELVNLIKTVVHGQVQWSDEGGPAVLTFTGSLMVLDGTREMHEQVITLCRSLLAVAKSYDDADRRKLADAEKQLAQLRADLASNKEAIRGLCVKAGRDEVHLTPQVIFAEAARAKPDAPKPEELLALADLMGGLKVPRKTSWPASRPSAGWSRPCGNRSTASRSPRLPVSVIREGDEGLEVAAPPPVAPRRYLRRPPPPSPAATRSPVTSIRGSARATRTSSIRPTASPRPWP